MELGYMKHDINTMNDIKIRRLVQAEGAGSGVATARSMLTKRALGMRE